MSSTKAILEQKRERHDKKGPDFRDDAGRVLRHSLSLGWLITWRHAIMVLRAVAGRSCEGNVDACHAVAQADSSPRTAQPCDRATALGLMRANRRRSSANIRALIPGLAIAQVSVPAESDGGRNP